jgi:uncharacterized membrane protein
MKTLNRTYFLMILFYATNAHCKNLEASAKSMVDGVSRVVNWVCLIGFLIAGGSYALGKNDASMRMNNALYGAIIFALAPAILQFIKSIS